MGPVGEGGGGGGKSPDDILRMSGMNRRILNMFESTISLNVANSMITKTRLLKYMYIEHLASKN